MKHRRQPILRPPEFLQQPRDAIEAEPVAYGRQLGKAVELRLDGRTVRPGEVRHQAAFFSGTR